MEAWSQGDAHLMCLRILPRAVSDILISPVKQVYLFEPKEMACTHHDIPQVGLFEQIKFKENLNKEKHTMSSLQASDESKQLIHRRLHLY
jgi:hypothetical protein